MVSKHTKTRDSGLFARFANEASRAVGSAAAFGVAMVVV